MYNRLLNLSFLLLAAGFLSCESSTTPGNNTVTIVPSDRTLFIVNEGDFGKTNSSLDAILFHRDSTKVDTVLNKGILTKMGLGNDILISRNRVIVLDNGSNELDVVDADSLRLLATIPMGLDEPNKMALIAPDTLLVTRRNTTSAAIVDLNSDQIVDSIPLGAASVAVTVNNNKAFITTDSTAYAGPSSLRIVNLHTRIIEKTIPLVGSPEQARVDSNGLVIIEADADYMSRPPKLYYILPASDSIIDSLTVGTANSSAELISGYLNFIILDGKIYQLPAPGGQLGATVIDNNVSYYNGFCDATSNDLYLGVSDFTSGTGRVDVYDDATRTFKRSFTTGIAPAHFAFYH